MLKKLHLISSCLIVALGVVHLLFTMMAYEKFTLDAFFFIGSGVAIVLSGFLNLIFSRLGGKDRLVWILCLIGNVIVMILFVIGLFIIGEPQVFFGTILFAFVTVSTLWQRDR